MPTMTRVSHDLTNKEREAIICFAPLASKGDFSRRLPNGTISAAASHFSCSGRTIRRIRLDAKRQGVRENQIVDVKNKRKGRAGRKTVYTADVVKAKFLAIPKRYRTSFRSISERTGNMISMT